MMRNNPTGSKSFGGNARRPKGAAYRSSKKY